MVETIFFAACFEEVCIDLGGNKLVEYDYLGFSCVAKLTFGLSFLCMFKISEWGNLIGMTLI